jgi:hypothetical protein
MEIEIELPFPGGMADGKLSTEFLNIDKLKKTGLQDLCRGFGLSSSGNKDELKARLRTFSSNREEWQRLIPTPRRMHRGPKTGKVAKSKSVKQSARRIEEIIGSTSRPSIPHLPICPPTQVAPPTLTQSQTILKWADAFSSAHPYVSKEDRLQARTARLRRVQVPAQQQQDLPMHQVTTSSTDTRRPLDHTNTRLDQIAASLSILPSLLSIQPPIPSITIPHRNMAPPNPTPDAPLDLNPVPSPSPIGNPKTRTILLGDGTRIEFTANDVGPPPAVSFANDLPQLNRMWDDTSAFWDGNSVLVIKGVPIPIVYWKEVYARSKLGGSSWKPGHWKRVKGSWCEWESIVKRWRQSSEREFWREFSDTSGQKFSYTTIVDRLTQIRKEQDKKMADRARAHYGEEFNSIFCYKKSSVLFVKTKDRDIAKQFQQELAKQGLLPGVANDAGSDMDLDSE